MMHTRAASDGLAAQVAQRREREARSRAPPVTGQAHVQRAGRAGALRGGACMRCASTEAPSGRSARAACLQPRAP